MTAKPRIGLLPLYLALYDVRMPELRSEFEPFIQDLVDGFTTRGVEVHCADVCRVQNEVVSALGVFDEADVDLIVTLHLAYSPSLETADSLIASPRPLLLLDTTMDVSFGLDVDPARIMQNHGVHGVQDLASVLRRCERHYEIVAGHLSDSRVLDRASAIARSACAARLLRTMRTMRIGETFAGMGDFAVADSLLEALLGVTVVQRDVDDLATIAADIGEDYIHHELKSDRDRYEVNAPEHVHCRSIRVGLALRRLLEIDQCDSFSFNFGAFNSSEGPIATVPFLEASKAMARGMGYAGEGDVLTASLVGALNAAFGRTTFTEIFCPDWKGNTLFLSHMGEVNPETSAGVPRLCEKDFPWAGALNPAVLTCATAPGPAVLVNLAPGPKNTFTLILAPVESLGDGTHPGMRDVIRAWIRPKNGDIAKWLERYSQLGGTHHSALVMDGDVDALAAFGRYAGLSVEVAD
ncbi:MAG: L-arabinose isomerase [Candidatus Hydrogenedentota bacterium]